MGINPFKKKSTAATPTSTNAATNDDGSVASGADVDKAASTIQARARGLEARSQTQSLKDAAAPGDNPLLKCLPCLAPK